MCIPLVGFVVSWSFPLYLNLFKAKELDGYLKSKVGILDADSNTSVENHVGSPGVAAEKRTEGTEFGAVDYGKEKDTAV